MNEPQPNNPNAPSRHQDEVTAALDEAMRRIDAVAERGYIVTRDLAVEQIQRVKGEHQVKTADSDAPCEAEIHFGPGHQSVARCQARGPHELHRVSRGLGEPLYWKDEDADENGRVFSGYFNDSPRYEDGEPT